MGNRRRARREEGDEVVVEGGSGMDRRWRRRRRRVRDGFFVLPSAVCRLPLQDDGQADGEGGLRLDQTE